MRARLPFTSFGTSSLQWKPQSEVFVVHGRPISHFVLGRNCAGLRPCQSIFASCQAFKELALFEGVWVCRLIFMQVLCGLDYMLISYPFDLNGRRSHSFDDCTLQTLIKESILVSTGIKHMSKSPFADLDIREQHFPGQCHE